VVGSGCSAVGAPFVPAGGGLVSTVMAIGFPRLLVGVLLDLAGGDAWLPV